MEEFILNYAAIIISVIALSSILYKDYFKGAKLDASINQIISLRIPGINKQNLLLEMLIDDMLSETKSKTVNLLLTNQPHFADIIKSKNRDIIKGELIKILSKTEFKYDPPESIIRNYFNDKQFASSFYIPLIVYNSGAKYAEISSLVLIAEDTKSSDKKWVFTPFIELSEGDILNRKKKQTDSERISNIFTGFTVGPGESLRIDPQFIPMHDSDNKIISRSNILPGKYKMKIYGFDSKGTRYLETDEVKFDFNEKNLLDSFKGTESATFFNTEKNISEALK